MECEKPGNVITDGSLSKSAQAGAEEDHAGTIGKKTYSRQRGNDREGIAMGIVGRCAEVNDIAIREGIPEHIAAQFLDMDRGPAKGLSKGQCFYTYHLQWRLFAASFRVSGLCKGGYYWIEDYAGFSDDVGQCC